uniref:Uncharacterized protein n=1 Tax=Anopheles arabiensis TaxID=7173 RepID=A0A499FTB1_ANOAR
MTPFYAMGTADHQRNVTFNETIALSATLSGTRSVTRPKPHDVCCVLKNLHNALVFPPGKVPHFGYKINIAIPCRWWWWLLRVLNSTEVTEEKVKPLWGGEQLTTLFARAYVEHAPASLRPIYVAYAHERRPAINSRITTDKSRALLLCVCVLAVYHRKTERKSPKVDHKIHPKWDGTSSGVVQT